jgi:hypothetical protein
LSVLETDGRARVVLYDHAMSVRGELTNGVWGEPNPVFVNLYLPG